MISYLVLSKQSNLKKILIFFLYLSILLYSWWSNHLRFTQAKWRGRRRVKSAKKAACVTALMKDSHCAQLLNNKSITNRFIIINSKWHKQPTNANNTRGAAHTMPAGGRAAANASAWLLLLSQCVIILIINVCVLRYFIGSHSMMS